MSTAPKSIAPRTSGNLSLERSCPLTVPDSGYDMAMPRYKRNEAAMKNIPRRKRRSPSGSSIEKTV